MRPLLESPFALMVTGHRPQKLGVDWQGTAPLAQAIRRALRDRIQQVRALHPDLVGITGMALGVDQWFAQELIALDIPFEAYVPFAGQESRWSAEQRQAYNELLARAQHIEVVCSGGYAPWKMQKRNEAMVDAANCGIGVWDGSEGGTANCWKYAQKMQLELFRVDPRDLEG